jgi:hypothetical protein
MARCRGWWVWMVVVLWLDAGSVTAQEVLHVYGPGGPAPAMREAAVRPPSGWRRPSPTPISSILVRSS